MNTQFGLPLKVASKQTMLPIITEPRGDLLGYFAIASTTFAEGNVPETFALAEGSVRITSVTPPVRVDDGSGYGVEQYVAAVYTEDEAKFEPQGGYSAWIDINDTGNFAIWFNPAQVRFLRQGRGVLINSLLVNMQSYGGGALDPVDPPDVVNGTQRWVANLSVSINELGCSFFDFNWMETFEAVLKAQQPYNNIEPLTITTIANPPGGAFKSTIVAGDGQQAFSQGAVIFSTVRIIRLQDVLPGNFDFVFRVSDTKGNFTDVTLTLEVV